MRHFITTFIIGTLIDLGVAAFVAWLLNIALWTVYVPLLVVAIIANARTAKQVWQQWQLNRSASRINALIVAFNGARA